MYPINSNLAKSRRCLHIFHTDWSIFAREPAYIKEVCVPFQKGEHSKLLAVMPHKVKKHGSVQHGAD